MAFVRFFLVMKYISVGSRVRIEITTNLIIDITNVYVIYRSIYLYTYLIFIRKVSFPSAS